MVPRQQCEVPNVIRSTSTGFSFFPYLAEGTLDFVRLLGGHCVPELSLGDFGVSRPPVIPAAFAIITRGEHAVTKMVVRVALQDVFRNGNNAVEIALEFA